MADNPKPPEGPRLTVVISDETSAKIWIMSKDVKKFRLFHGRYDNEIYDFMLIFLNTKKATNRLALYHKSLLAYTVFVDKDKPTINYLAARVKILRESHKKGELL